MQAEVILWGARSLRWSRQWLDHCFGRQVHTRLIMERLKSCAPALIAAGAAATIGYIAYSSASRAVQEYEAAAAKKAQPSLPQRSKPQAQRQCSQGPGAATNAASSSSTVDQQQDSRTAEAKPASRSGKPEQLACCSSSAPASEPVSPTTPPGHERECSHCHKRPADPMQLQRCSRCKQAWYCSQNCQRQAWPAHKLACSRSSKEGAVGQQDAAAGAAAAAASPSADKREAAQGDAMAAAVRSFLEQAELSDDPLQRGLQQGVMIFVGGDLPAAIQQLTEALDGARKAEQWAVAGEACRWLGHAHGRSGEAGKAAAAFAMGCQIGKEHDKQRLLVECLSGLGALQRNLGQLEAARGFLSEALAAAGQLGDPALKASALCQLGTVLIASDVTTAVKHLQESVELREEQVVALHAQGERSSLAAAIFEHAGSMVALAGALYVAQRYSDAAEAYCKALEVFKLVEDPDKMAKCLVNLSNIYELQMPDKDHLERAAYYRRQLYQLAVLQLRRDVPTSCALCQQEIQPMVPTTGQPKDCLLLLACLHAFHHHCWIDRQQQEQEEAVCPCCKGSTPAAEVDA